jgi:hypothetical protein
MYYNMQYLTFNLASYATGIVLLHLRVIVNEQTFIPLSAMQTSERVSAVCVDLFVCNRADQHARGSLSCLRTGRTAYKQYVLLFFPEQRARLGSFILWVHPITTRKLRDTSRKTAAACINIYWPIDILHAEKRE